MKTSYLIVGLLIMLACFGCKKEQTPVNSLPQIDSIALDPTATRPGGTINIQVFASDADGDLLSYKYFPEAGTITGSGSSVSWNAPDNSGNYNIEIAVSDSKDTVTTDQTLSVMINNEPIITEVVISADSVLSGGVANITVYASDIDGDALAYFYTPSGGTISGNGPSVNWTAPYATGTYSINVTVIDGYGGTATGSASVKVIAGLPIENLVAHWLFNGNANDATTNGHNGTPTAGHPFFGGGAAPQLVADRFGNANYCYHFDQGSNIEVPYSTELNPQSMTISLWVKMEEQPNNDYLIAMNRWNGWKLSLQDQNFLFFTLKALNSGDTTYYDRDSNPSAIVAETWTHVVVSFTDGFMNFYVDGELVKAWDNTAGTAIPVDNINLSIGSDLPTGVYTTVEWDDFYVNWGGYFKGTMDDVRFYDIALTPPQVASIYNYEKDNVVEE
jgi:hypothetical protein